MRDEVKVAVLVNGALLSVMAISLALFELDVASGVLGYLIVSAIVGVVKWQTTK